MTPKSRSCSSLAPRLLKYAEAQLVCESNFDGNQLCYMWFNLFIKFSLFLFNFSFTILYHVQKLMLKFSTTRSIPFLNQGLLIQIYSSIHLFSCASNMFFWAVSFSLTNASKWLSVTLTLLEQTMTITFQVLQLFHYFFNFLLLFEITNINPLTFLFSSSNALEVSSFL